MNYTVYKVAIRRLGFKEYGSFNIFARKQGEEYANLFIRVRP